MEGTCGLEHGPTGAKMGATAGVDEDSGITRCVLGICGIATCLWVGVHLRLRLLDLQLLGLGAVLRGLLLLLPRSAITQVKSIAPKHHHVSVVQMSRKKRCGSSNLPHAVLPNLLTWHN